MKKILIVSHAMEIGGAERALLGLLESLDPTQVSVDLFLLRHEGELLELIPDYINLLPSIPAYTVLARPIVQTIREGHLLLSMARLVGKFRAKQYNQKHGLTESGVAIEYSHKYTKAFMPPIQSEVEYDLAISFLTPHYFVAEKVRAKKKIAWIHTDYSVVQVDTSSELAMWSRFDFIASISENVTETFLSVFPSLKEKILLIENILPKTLIDRQADAFTVEDEMLDDGSIKLLSIGRFSNQKNFDNVPDICHRILEAGLDIKWYLIGYGGEETLIRQRIAEAGMEDKVIILGKKENPYPYIKACDLYVQPSRYEGKAVTVREAQMLCKPVVITRYATSGSQLEDGVDGVIVPMDNAGCAEGIVQLLKSPERMNWLAVNCAQRNYTNAGEIEKIYRLIQE
ncbi:MAG: glycosyltransferase [Lachnospiraceae bacterium]